MLCIISYDLHGVEKDYQSLYDKMEALGATYRCSESTVLLHAGIDAGKPQRDETVLIKKARKALFLVRGVGEGAPMAKWNQ